MEIKKNSATRVTVSPPVACRVRGPTPRTDAMPSTSERPWLHEAPQYGLRMLAAVDPDNPAVLRFAAPAEALPEHHTPTRRVAHVQRGTTAGIQSML